MWVKHSKCKMVLCAAYGCNSLSGRDKVQFFRFPKDSHFRKIWKTRIGRASPSKKSKVFSPNKHSRLCSVHFTDDQYTISRDFWATSVATRIFGERWRKMPSLPSSPTKQKTPGSDIHQNLSLKKEEISRFVYKYSIYFSWQFKLRLRKVSVFILELLMNVSSSNNVHIIIYKQ